ncbi:hypothetical protein [Spirosoma sp. 209]|uniref:hypothetical protein n=1 Tax=Spirosoma sp. 209 TaxID=1955701 RepID=UPI001115C0F9|nr:hypothetical protein [Spirosoma sp. 209]
MQRIDRLTPASTTPPLIAYGPSLSDLLFEPVDNPGGNCLVRFVPVIGVSAISTVNGPVSFRSGYRWLTCYGTDGTIGFEEDQEETDNGPIWNVSIDGWLPGDSPQRRQLLADLVRYRFMVEVEDYAGLVRRAGTLEQALSFRYQFSTGKQLGDRRGTQLTFSGQLTKPSVPIL